MEKNLNEIIETTETTETIEHNILNKPLCAIYLRVSPTFHKKIKYTSLLDKRQAEEEEMHSSLVQALEMCTKAAEKEGYEIFKIYKDEYVSGKDAKFMLSFQEMMNDARAHKFVRVYCRRVSRLGRNRNQTLKAQIELDELGITINFVENKIDTATVAGRMTIGFFAELDEMDREEIVENTSRGRDLAKARGVKFGQPKKKFDVRMIRRTRLLPVTDPDYRTWDQLEETFKVTRSTMISRLKEEGYWDFERRCVK